jgi:hypothetical protein
MLAAAGHWTIFASQMTTYSAVVNCICRTDPTGRMPNRMRLADPSKDRHASGDLSH